MAREVFVNEKYPKCTNEDGRKSPRRVHSYAPTAAMQKNLLMHNKHRNSMFISRMHERSDILSVLKGAPSST